MIEKIEEFASSFPSLSHSLNVDWKKRENMNSSGLECEACLVHLKGINGESE